MRLPPVLSATDLPSPELQAARLDGELLQLGPAWAPIDEVISTRHRAAAVHAGLLDRLIVEQRSAAWVWGAAPSPPSHPQLCVAVGARVRLHHLLPVREVVIDADEVAEVGGARVTTPLRTVIDLVRFGGEFGELERRTAVTLLREHGLSVQRCIEELDRRRNLPNRRRAHARLATLE